MSKAIVLFLSSDNYIYFILHCYRCLQEVNTKTRIVCTYTEDVSKKTIAMLNSVGLETIFLSGRSDIYNTIGNKECVKYKLASKKLLMFNTKIADKILYLDSDIEVYKNIDHLLDMPHMSAVEDEAPNRAHDKYFLGCSIFCAGLFVWDYNTKVDFDRLLTVINLLTPNKSWNDQSILNLIYNDWVNRQELHLHPKYSYMVSEANITRQDYDSNNITAKHFIGSSKTFIPFDTDTIVEATKVDINSVWDLTWSHVRQEMLEYYKRINETISIYNNRYGLGLKPVNIENLKKI